MQPMEQLESRRLLANFSASSVAELIADINAANAAGGSNTITLKAATAFTLNATDNNSAGPTGLPRIETGNDLTIFGSGDTIQRNTARGTPAFRLFTVLQGGSLTLNDLTLSNGRMNTGFSFDGAQGGGIYSEGALNLNHVTVQNCIAEGAIGGGFASGGGIASYSVLNVVDSRFKNNQALGGDGAWGGLAKGGALYVYNTATVTSTTFSSNLARGGSANNFRKDGQMGGNAFGGAIYAWFGRIEIRATTISQNAAEGGAGINKRTSGVGQGGGLYIWSAPNLSTLVSLDSFTQAHATGNTASTSDNDIFGTFTLLA